ncbi:protein TolB [Youhaiella tibetensis]|uniref:Tol-Pal system protein TolB n=1 Tax=Paradevosia tibetensis TaxID=1447062 RepID=A0A5B9DSB2_9HYPH|nr:Tol-Pal system beta propeller repeat protein TolB [Youhaiella tibetensis]AKR56928.1 translocation protein TolB [Devosia sp. H5989]QEE21942.1 Tol-Pal system protein TolB [Youhaiella tibetensis]GGF46838.1 protein TolB [Youhaiella tibetensis]
MTLLTRRNALKLGIAGSAAMLAARPASALVQITVGGGDFQPLPIAIPNFASSDPQFGADIADIVRANLRRSGLFNPLDPASLPTQVGDVQATPDFGSWKGVGADALVMGAVERGGQIQSSVRVWDTAQGAQVVGKSYATDANSWRRVAHIISDAIYTSLTGEGGYFDTRVVYTAESGPKANRVKRLAIMDQDGANSQYLTDGRTLALTPRFSPNADMVAYMNFEEGNPQVYLLQLSTGQQQRLGSFGQMTFAPRFSPDGRQIAFSVEAGGATNLYSLAIGGGQPVQLTSGAAIDTSPSYSPDGSQIVFESDRGGSPQIYLMNAGGGGANRISYGQGSYSTPVWSPKGDLIAFTRQSGGQFQIGIMRPDGSNERILVSSFHAEGPTWAPNGRVIMFFQDPGGNDGPALHTVDVWGRNIQKIPTETFASDPAWSPLRG